MISVISTLQDGDNEQSSFSGIVSSGECIIIF